MPPILLWGWSGGVFGTGIAMTINRAPQQIESVRARGASGVSSTSWFLRDFGCALWIMFYTGTHLSSTLTATVFAGLAGLANLAIALLATWRHARAREELAANEIFAVLAIVELVELLPAWRSAQK